ncbi:MAG: DUF4214 domain-containing protein [Rubellimicrobium sp.]|nr:DUF4214 domain-containing protein [Rubellimicrobium sp.]
MGWLNEIGQVADGPPTHVDGIRALALAGGRLVSTTGWQGGLIVRDAGDLAYLGQKSLTRPQGQAGDPALTTVTLGGREALVLHGLGADARLWWADLPGDLLAGTTPLDFGGRTITALAALALPGGGDALYTTDLGSNAITLWRRDPDGTLHETGTITVPWGTTTAPPVPPPGSGAEIVAPQVFATAAGNWLVTAETRGASLSLWHLGPDGAATSAGRLTAAEGLAVGLPSALAVTQAGGRDFILVGAAGSGSLTVVELTAAGDMVIRDHVLDDRATRFGGLSVLQAVQAGGQTLVLAGGADDGLTLMSLLPSGRLVHLETLADSTGLTLANPLALVVHVAGGNIIVDVAGEGETGQSRLALPLAALGDVLQAGDAGGTLSGGAGGDILIDGPGSDVLQGGAGADTFVLGPDGRPDTILDFTLGEDMIDLSAWGRIRDPGALSIRRINGGGVEISHGEEVLQVFSGTARPLQVTDFNAANLLGLDHVPIIPATPWQPPPEGPDWPLLPHLPGPGRLFAGLPGDDVVAGTSGDDVMFGGGGRDRLSGGAGDDLIFGEGAVEPFDTVAGQVVRLYQLVLGRAPDAAGFADWAGRLLSPQADMVQVVRGFIESPEFRAAVAPGSAGFVTALLAHRDGTAPAPAEVAAGVARLAAGIDRADFTLALLGDAGLGRAVIDTAFHHSAAGIEAGDSALAFHLLRGVLGRDPDAGEFTDALHALAGGLAPGDVVDGIMDAGNRLRPGQGSNADFVSRAYEMILGRAPDDDGLADWVARLRGGASRADVVAGIAGSIEAADLGAAALRDWMRAQGPDDRLEGGAGDNVLAGGLWADTFVFAQADGGRQRVLDLEPWDVVELQGFGYGTADEALARISQHGADAVLADQGVEIVFHHVDAGTLTADMFILS